MPPSFAAQIDFWIKGYGATLTAKLDSHELDDRQVHGYTVRPRPIVQAMVADLLAAPTEFLGSAFGMQAATAPP